MANIDSDSDATRTSEKEISISDVSTGVSDETSIGVDDKILLITAGPTGSGKTGIIKPSLEILLGTTDPPNRKFLVDDLVENSDEYKEEVDKIFERFGCRPPYSSTTCNPDNPNDDLLKAFKDAYVTIRNKPGCQKNPENLNCDDLNNKNIALAMENNENVVIETTGSSIPVWSLDLGNENYKVVFAYAIVDYSTLVKRNASRARKTMEAYQSDKQKKAPRLINIRDKVFLPIVTQICETLLELRLSCLTDDNTSPIPETCKSKKLRQVKSIYDLLIFDTSSRQVTLIYDHRNKDHARMNRRQFTDLVYKAFFKDDYKER